MSAHCRHIMRPSAGYVHTLLTYFKLNLKVHFCIVTDDAVHA